MTTVATAPPAILALVIDWLSCRRFPVRLYNPGMILKTLAFLLLAANGITGAGEAPAPPVAAAKPYEVVSPHGTRTDPYYWLRDDTRSRPEVLDYLKAENAYFQAMTTPYAGLTDKLAREIVARRDVDRSTAP